MLTYSGNFEVHLTIRPEDSLMTFQAWCATEQCKYVHIVLARGAQLEQPMATWRRSDTSLPEVRAQAMSRASDLERAGLIVVRLKIEADPSNEDVPQTDEEASLRPARNYFEHHIKLRRETAADKTSLLQICLGHAAHLSRNAWQLPNEGREERFVTLRSYRMGRFAAERQLHRLREALESAGENIVDIESEYTVHDSNPALDLGWLPRDAL